MTERLHRGSGRSIPAWRWALVAAVLCALMACSVSTPRDGFTAAGQLGAVAPGVTASAAAPGQSRSGAAVSPSGSGTAGTSATGVEAGPQGAAGASPATGGATNDTAAAGAQPDVGPSEPTVGVTEDEIVISAVGGFTGPLGPVLEQIYEQGFITWQRQVNSNGGIHGRQVIVRKVDHRDTTDGGVAACHEAQNNGSYLVMIIHGQGEGNLAAASCLEDAGVLNVSFIPHLPDDSEHTFAYLPTSGDAGWNLAGFVRDIMGDANTNLGVIHLTLPIYAAATDAYVAEARRLGMNIVATEAIEPNQASYTPQLLRLRDAGVENLAIMASLEATGILRDARAIGFRPRMTGMYWHYDTISQVARDLADGAHVVRESVTTDGDAFVRFEQVRRQYNPSSTPTNGESLILYGDGLLAGRILEAAGPSPTLATLRVGLESMGTYDNGILPPITWGPGDRIGTRSMFPAVCCTSDWRWRGAGPAREHS